MSLIDDLAGGLVLGVQYSVDTATPAGTVGLISAGLGGTAWLCWKLSNPYRGQRTTPLTDVGATTTTTILTDLSFDGSAVRIPAAVQTPGAAMVTSSENTQTNIGTDGRTAYDTVGVDAIRAAVEQFYAVVAADPLLAGYFNGIDRDRLIRHQALFLGQLWGGPVHFDVDGLVTAHRDLGITAEAYWRTVAHLMTTITGLGVPDWVCLFTLATLYDVRGKVIAAPVPADEDHPPTVD